LGSAIFCLHSYCPLQTIHHVLRSSLSPRSDVLWREGQRGKKSGPTRRDLARRQANGGRRRREGSGLRFYGMRGRKERSETEKEERREERPGKTKKMGARMIGKRYEATRGAGESLG
jgi:hypothetical protein